MPLPYADLADGHCAPIVLRKLDYLVRAKTAANRMWQSSMKCSLGAVPGPDLGPDPAKRSLLTISG